MHDAIPSRILNGWLRLEEDLFHLQVLSSLPPQIPICCSIFVFKLYHKTCEQFPCSIFIHHREACMMIYVFTSVPLLFISGISWSGTAIPKLWEVISCLFHCTFGIKGLVRINDIGATLTDVLTAYRLLWIHTGVYFLITCIVYRRQITLSRRHVYERLKEIKKRRKTNIV